VVGDACGVTHFKSEPKRAKDFIVFCEVAKTRIIGHVTFVHKSLWVRLDKASVPTEGKLLL
jgi:hypothetical protein